MNNVTIVCPVCALQMTTHATIVNVAKNSAQLIVTFAVERIDHHCPQDKGSRR